ncbi:MAG: hypothetical protein O7I42_22075 [Alphaproteobacteria bacterium]|nr:hypothetical protein [Alphaproteobacteria bacterium]
MNLIILAFKDPADGLDWHEQSESLIASFEERIAEYKPRTIRGTVSETNIGRGADAPAILISLIEIGSLAFFAIPAAHKLIREACSEWKLIYNELKAVVGWLSRGRPVVLPEEYLYLVALEELSKSNDIEEFETLGCDALDDDNPSLSVTAGIVVKITDGDRVLRIAVSYDGTVLWKDEKDPNEA